MKYDKNIKTAVAAGVMAGMRSLSAPAFVARMKRGKGEDLLRMLSRLETGADKLPFMPSRLQAPSLIARSASGAVCAIWAADEKESSERLKLGLIGAGAALAASFAAYYLRKQIVSRFGIKDAWVGSAEDLAVRAIGSRVFAA